MTEHIRLVECTLCHRSKPMNSDHCDPATDLPWEPFYGDAVHDVDVDGPVCPECVAENLVFDPVAGYYHLPTNFAVVETR